MTWWEDAARAESRDWRYDPDDNQPDAAEQALNAEDTARHARHAAAAVRAALNQQEGP